MNKPGEFKLVAQGQDLISIDDWGPPISDYPGLLDLHIEAESFGVPFPLRELSEHLIAARLLEAPLADRAREDFQPFLEELLKDDFMSVTKLWETDMPGGSSFYVKAYIRKGRLRKVRPLLKASLQFLNEWRVKLEAGKASKNKEPKVQVASRISDLAKVAEIKAAKWEDELSEQIIEQYNLRSTVSFSRLNFLVFDANIFFLDCGWRHSIGGSPRKVADRLKQSGLPVVYVSVLKSSSGWSPYFARSRPEELGLGWHDASIELDAGSLALNNLMVVARSKFAPEPRAKERRAVGCTI